MSSLVLTLHIHNRGVALVTVCAFFSSFRAGLLCLLLPKEIAGEHSVLGLSHAKEHAVLGEEGQAGHVRVAVARRPEVVELLSLPRQSFA